ncbi:metalloregulator ArsR/SmtB family transcription factor [Mesobacillus subterraneus]|uniref:ArsR/SmtB family transcription factor n=1 Tax=Mesobacillus subterraneus TaxID=285983 RepID=UPI00203E267E|nr:metalloregulator ArsR/SmtB family transcription factor [Mesobacillus subterraneus]MCM3667360.1 metalloregulator ArsR/SmtB family transcription factor [Mesobacillus subterraneus]MCM3686351.1 metalloregulator ArsR/SmtB family transcription factor [Mesobacillus subterraneus]
MAIPQAKHDVFQAVADPTRRKILKLLAEQEMPIALITDSFPITRTAINKHLFVLSEAGLVSSKRVGRETRYSLQPDPLKELQEWLSFFELYWDNKLSALKNFVESDE